MTHHPRGFASIMALVLLGLVAASLLALGANFVADARRTRIEADAAQLRELVTAGTATAIADARHGGLSSHDVQLPQAMILRDAALSLDSNAADGIVIVRAKLGTRRTDQALHFTRDGDEWKLASVDEAPATQPWPAATQPSDRSTAASQRS